MESNNGFHSHGGSSEEEPHSHAESLPPSSPSRAVVIDADSTAGALVLSSSADHWGTQIEIHNVMDPLAKTHV